MAIVGAALAAIAGGEVAIILIHQGAAGNPPSARDAVWLAAFALFCLAMSAALRGARAQAAVAVESACTIAMTAAVPCYAAGFLLAWVAWQAGWLLERRFALVLVASQAAALAAVSIVVPWDRLNSAAITMQVVLQGMAVAAALSARREADGRRTVEALHAELERAQVRLAEQARAAERGRVARELHDVLGHRLIALNLNLEIAERSGGAVALGPARRLVRGLLDDMRWVVRAFREQPADLRASIEDLVGDLEKPRPHVAVDDELSQASPVVAHTLLRCVQELVTNVLKHADAENLWIRVARQDGYAEASVRDNGRGDRRGERESDSGVGLPGMRERLAMLGGELLVSRPPEGGWSVTARVPLAATEETR